MKKMVFLLGIITILGTISCKKDVEVPKNPNNPTNSDNPENPGTKPRTVVPDELVATWECGSIDFKLWEDYREGYYAGRNAIPSREVMILSKNGDAKFYRYEFAYGLYEELIDCTGTVTFNNDGTFTFYPIKGRKRFYDTHYSPHNVDRALTATELTLPKLAGKRGYTYIGTSNPPAVRIVVPGSAPYNWYKKS